MKENDIPLKKPYLPPKLVTVAFKVEDAFTSRVSLFIPMGSSGARGTEDYSVVANSGNGFWGEGSSVGSSSGENYEGFTWNW